MVQDDTRLVDRREAFAQSYVACRSVPQAAMAAGLPQWLCVREGMALLASIGVQRRILALTCDPAEKIAFAERWGLDLDGNIADPPTLSDRIQAARDALADAVRVPEPIEIVFTRKPLSRRAHRRANARQEA